jgi:cytochrome c biogenesis protein CcmG/thiol:disulfide interchange protein DsbE
MNWKRAVIAAAVALPIVALLRFGMTRDPRAIASPLPGRPAPTFELEVFAPGDAAGAPAVGQRVNFSDLKGNVVVVNFWASWCLPCRDEHSGLSEIATRYADKGVKFVGIVYNDVTANAVRWIREMGGQTYPAVLDPGTRTAIDFGVYGVPETFFIGRDGTVASKYTGPIPPSVLAQRIDSLLAATALP